MVCSAAADEQAGEFGEQVGAPGGELAHFGDGGGVFFGGEVTPFGVVGGGAAELGGGGPAQVGRRPG